MAEGTDKIDAEEAPTSEQIRARIEDTRLEMSQTIDEIEARLSPRRFLSGGRAAIVPVVAAGLTILAVVAYRRRRARLKRSYRHVRW
jgi:glutathione S-transferase